MDTEFHSESAAPVISESVETLTDVRTMYAVPALVDCTVADCVLFAVADVRVTVGGPLSIVTDEVVTADVGPVFPARSVTELLATSKITSPSLQPVMETLMIVPLDATGVKTQPVAVPPALEMSLLVNPTTDSLNVNVYVFGNDVIGDDGAAIDTVGAVLSILNVDVDDATETFPAASVNVAVTDHAPSVRPVREQVPDDEVTDPLHVTDVPLRVAVTAKVPVASGVATVTDTELLVVRASLELTPVSDPAAISGAFGADGAVRSMVSCVPVNAVAGPELPAMSVMDADFNVGVTVPAEHPTAATVIVVPVDVAGVIVHPVAVPATVKSLESRPVIASLNVSVNSGDT